MAFAFFRKKLFIYFLGVIFRVLTTFYDFLPCLGGRKWVLGGLGLFSRLFNSKKKIFPKFFRNFFRFFFGLFWKFFCLKKDLNRKNFFWRTLEAPKIAVTAPVWVRTPKNAFFGVGIAFYCWFGQIIEMVQIDAPSHPTAALGKNKKITTPVGFEPTRAKPNGLAGRRLNHSAKVSFVCESLWLPVYPATLHKVCEKIWACVYSICSCSLEVEHWSYEPRVEGSIPSRSILRNLCPCGLMDKAHPS